MIAARVFGNKKGGPGVTLTLGKKGDGWPYSGSIDAASGMGNKLEEKDINEISIEENKIVSTPAYMKDIAKPHEVYEGIEKLVKEISKRIK